MHLFTNPHSPKLRVPLSSLESLYWGYISKILALERRDKSRRKYSILYDKGSCWGERVGGEGMKERRKGVFGIWVVDGLGDRTGGDEELVFCHLVFAILSLFFRLCVFGLDVRLVTSGGFTFPRDKVDPVECM